MSPHRARSPPSPWINFSALLVFLFFVVLSSFFVGDTNNRHPCHWFTCQASGCKGRCCLRGLFSSLSSQQTRHSVLAACRSPATELTSWILSSPDLLQLCSLLIELVHLICKLRLRFRQLCLLWRHNLDHSRKAMKGYFFRSYVFKVSVLALTSV